MKDLSTGYTGGFAGLNDEGVLADDHMVYADTIRGASGLVDPFSNTKLKSVWDFNTMSDILGPVDAGKGGKAYNTYRIYRKAAWRTLVRPYLRTGRQQDLLAEEHGGRCAEHRTRSLGSEAVRRGQHIRQQRCAQLRIRRRRHHLGRH